MARATATRTDPGATRSTMTHLECSRCGRRHEAHRLIGPSPCCDAPLLARYDLEAARESINGSDTSLLFPQATGLWRYAALLPDPGPEGPVTLGEGGTPLLETRDPRRLKRLLLKDESGNPTGTFKARGMSVAVTRARALGATHLRAPTAGNAGGALASYAARAGMQATVAMPRDAADANKREVRATGGRLMEVDGLIGDCARALQEDTEARGAFDVSTLREPYRMEGKKTVGFELWQQNGGSWPDAVLFPTGGGMGILAIRKAHEELAALGLETGDPPRLVAVQAEGCAPFVQAMRDGDDTVGPVEDARTVAGGIRVPTPKADRLVLRDLRETGGGAVAVREEALIDGMKRVARETGLLVGPESGAAYAGVDAALEAELLHPGETACVFLTGTGLKHMELYA